jgi:hypothetical protein
VRAIAAAAAAGAVIAAACGKRAPREEPAPALEPAVPAATGDGGVAAAGDGGAPGDGGAAEAAGWPELADLPRTDAVRVVSLPTKPDVPRFSLGGPVIAGEVAVIASSQLGFAGVDWRRGAIAWTKPAGLHVAPPVVLGDGSVALVGECFNAPAAGAPGIGAPGIGANERLLGCLRVVTPAGVDQAYMAIRGKPAAVEAFAAAAGPQALWRDGDRALRWRRGDRAIAVDLISGVAAPADSIAPPPVVVEYRGRRWEIEQEAAGDGSGGDDDAAEGGRIVARARRGGRPVWNTENRYTALLGAVWQRDAGPMIRIATLAGGPRGPRVRVIDMDATGSLRSANARAMPGIGLLGWGASGVGAVALAVRLDSSLRRDFIAGYGVSAMVMWVYPLPELPRPDRVGVAVAPDAVVVFHDGDTLTVLPELSAPPTPPAAGAGSSQIPTP